MKRFHPTQPFQHERWSSPLHTHTQVSQPPPPPPHVNSMSRTHEQMVAARSRATLFTDMGNAAVTNATPPAVVATSQSGLTGSVGASTTFRLVHLSKTPPYGNLTIRSPGVGISLCLIVFALTDQRQNVTTTLFAPPTVETIASPTSSSSVCSDVLWQTKPSRSIPLTDFYEACRRLGDTHGDMSRSRHLFDWRHERGSFLGLQPRSPVASAPETAETAEEVRRNR
jgi:hypothetical protein